MKYMTVHQKALKRDLQQPYTSHPGAVGADAAVLLKLSSSSQSIPGLIHLGCFP